MCVTGTNKTGVRVAVPGAGRLCVMVIAFCDIRPLPYPAAEKVSSDQRETSVKIKTRKLFVQR